MSTILRNLQTLQDRILEVPRITLFMIVKNESKVIRRCLESVKPFISSWVIVDTGSTDNTRSIIHEVMAGIPGAVHDSKWVGFAHNRSESVKFAQVYESDYLFTLDADEWVSGDFSKLTKNGPLAHAVMIDTGNGNPLPRTVLFKSGLPWSYQGDFHEIPVLMGQPIVSPVLEGLKIETRFEGSRHAEPNRPINDLLLMAQEVLKNPAEQHRIHALGRMLYGCGYKDLANQMFAHSKEYGAMIGYQEGA